MRLDGDVLRQAVERVTGSAPAPDQVWLAPLPADRDQQVNQLVLFLKPEVTAVSEGVRFEQVVAVLRDLLDKHAVDAGAVRVVNGAFLAQERLMSAHYGVINAISERGEAALSEAARGKLAERFGDEPVDLLGGHQFLREYPQFSPYALHILFSNRENVKLAPGTYACRLSVEGRELLLLNGFHPYQLERFTRPDAVTVLIEAGTRTPWQVLREDLAGATNPHAAKADSFRRTLLEQAGELGVPHVSQNYNGLHLSAGPLEGMAELRRFFAGEEEITVADTCFGRLLTGSGVAPATVERLAGNPTLRHGDGSGPAFDLTEEMDAAEAARTLRDAAAE